MTYAHKTVQHVHNVNMQNDEKLPHHLTFIFLTRNCKQIIIIDFIIWSIDPLIGGLVSPKQI
jgi:hypothetical protein